MDPFSLDHIIKDSFSQIPFIPSLFMLKNNLGLNQFGGMGNRTPDIQLAKLTLYQLSYTPLLGYATVVNKT